MRQASGEVLRTVKLREGGKVRDDGGQSPPKTQDTGQSCKVKIARDAVCASSTAESAADDDDGRATIEAILKGAKGEQLFLCATPTLEQEEK